MTGKWDRDEVPKGGWACLDVIDLGDVDGTCEMCETQAIRYVHQMTHAEWPEVLGCGCICAGHMSGDPATAREREHHVRLIAARRARWLERSWRLSKAGNPYIRANGFHVVVYPTVASVAWGFRVTNRESERHIQSQKPYPTPEAAKLRSFDAIEWMKQRGM